MRLLEGAGKRVRFSVRRASFRSAAEAGAGCRRECGDSRGGGDSRLGAHVLRRNHRTVAPGTGTDSSVANTNPAHTARRPTSDAADPPGAAASVPGPGDSIGSRSTSHSHTSAANSTLRSSPASAAVGGGRASGSRAATTRADADRQPCAAGCACARRSQFGSQPNAGHAPVERVWADRHGNFAAPAGAPTLGRRI